MTPAPRPCVFLDRDGTINAGHGCMDDPASWEFTPGAPEALHALKAAGFALAVVSNQPGVAEGRCSREDVLALHAHMQRLLAEAGVALDAIAFCPHSRDAGCDCRKPRTGLAREVQSALGPIDYGASWVVGDRPTDTAFGHAIGARTALLRSGFWSPESIDVFPDVIADSLAGFASGAISPWPAFDHTHWRTGKILTPSAAAATAGLLRREGRRLVTTNGAFDLLHAGHLDQLEEAKHQGDILFVGLNSDASIAAAKGPGRPLLPLEARAALLAALACVDFVVPMAGSYAEEPMLSLLRSVKPDVHVNGPDYGAPSTWAEWPLLQRLGARAHLARKRNPLSTSALVRKAHSTH
jgi:rfaE bifunctional protein nucleotidyltransferase chain/domain